MAKNEKETKKVAPPAAIPEGYKKRTTELIGFWNMERGAVHFIPKSARCFDSDIEPSKPSILLIGDSVGTNPITDKDGKDLAANEGQPIGIWYKPGMSAVKDLMGVKVFMYITGEQDTGKPNPMKTFDVLSKQDGQTLFITEDFRRKSSHVALPFPIKGKEQHSAKAEDDDENFGEKGKIPF
jgi:hypothetical protein